MRLREWKEWMADTNDHGESATALHMIIMRSAVCDSCIKAVREATEHECTKVAKDIIAGKPIQCQCMVCNPEGEGVSGITTDTEYQAQRAAVQRLIRVSA